MRINQFAIWSLIVFMAALTINFMTGCSKKSGAPTTSGGGSSTQSVLRVKGAAR